MRLIFIGPPGGGKGTQTKLLSQRLSLRHIGTGDMLREAVRLDTGPGRLAKPYVTTGQMVPDDVVNEIIAAVFAAPDRPNSFVMDGYPRSHAQARVFDEILRKHGMKLDAVIHLVVPDQELVRRLSGRWNCPNQSCKATYHTVFKAPRNDHICDDCGTPLVQRDDDREETVRKRLQVYHELNTELIKHYRKRGLLVEVPGLGDFETVYENILQALRGGIQNA